MPTPEPLADPARRQLLLVTSALGACGVVATAGTLLASLAPSERARAAGAPVEADIAGLVPGELRVAEWRGKPVWILGRDPATVSSLARLDARLVDPHSRKDQQPEYARNAYRSIRPEVLVAVGICTHLGCSPSKVDHGAPAAGALGADWPGGFLCPCHGSTFDLAGRVFRNKPAPINLEVPPHRYASDTRLIIGEDTIG
jgi:ubiquinol-cytochrome c reductase iron-sulfur subunit